MSLLLEEFATPEACLTLGWPSSQGPRFSEEIQAVRPKVEEFCPLFRKRKTSLNAILNVFECFWMILNDFESNLKIFESNLC